LADKRLVEYIRNTISKGYDEDAVKKAILKNGYSSKDFNEALKEIISLKAEKNNDSTFNDFIDKIFNNSWKKEIILFYTILSLTLGLFSIEFIGLSISGNTILDYILLVAFSTLWGYFTYLTLTKVTSGKGMLIGYSVQLGVIIDLLINKRIVNYILAIVFVIIFFSLTYYINNKILDKNFTK
jgi:hypothetical protein